MKSRPVESAYALARARHAALDIDTQRAIRLVATIPVSRQCWQGDDVGGFEPDGGALGDGLAVTGNYPGKARTPDELVSCSKAFFPARPAGPVRWWRGCSVGVREYSRPLP